ncbi:MAG TPA: hypothetical protein VMA09_19780, partial [Candidatus Binataceae bacterium]|nr:hypothetical protein [Candidatus Binataceae bacterium]
VDEGSLLSDEILVWAETRRRTLGELSLESLPKAYQALGTDTISTTALGLYKSCGFVAVDRASYYVKHMR